MFAASRVQITKCADVILAKWLTKHSVSNQIFVSARFQIARFQITKCSCFSTLKLLQNHSSNNQTILSSPADPQKTLVDEDARLSALLSERTDYLGKLFGGSEKEIRQYLSDHHQILTMERDKFEKISQLFHKEGISLSEIFTYSTAYTRKYETLLCRFNELHSGGINQVKLAMVNLNRNLYLRRRDTLITRQKLVSEFGSVEELLSEYLGITLRDANVITDKHNWLQDFRLSTVKDKLLILKSHGIPLQEVARRPSVLKLSPAVLEEQLQKLQECGLPYGKQSKGVSYLSLLRIFNDQLESTIYRHKEKMEILGDCLNKTEYLCKHLDCTPEEVRGPMQKCYPRLKYVSVWKMRDILNFVLEELKLPSREVIKHATIFRFGLARLRVRLKEIQNQNLPVTVKLLSLDYRSYNKLMQKSGKV